MQVKDAIAKIRALLGPHDGLAPILLAVDGASGAGKTTLANGVAGALGASVVHVDDFYRPMDDDRRRGLDPQAGFELYFEWQRLMTEVLDPLVLGESAAYRRYDWERGQLGDDVVVVEPKGVVIVEGVYLLRPQLAGYWDATVFVDAPADLRRHRMDARGDDPDWVARWLAAEEWYLTHHDPAATADLVIPGH